MDRKNHELEMLLHGAEIEHEDQRRRQLTRLGYYFVDEWWIALVRYLMVVAGAQTLIVFGVIVAGGLPQGAANDPRWLLLFLPMATLPLFPFLIMKTRYALMVLGCFISIGALSWLGIMFQGWLVDQIT